MIDSEINDLFDLSSRLKPGMKLPSIFPLFDRYEAVRLLGMGGTSIVLEARDQVLGRSVALKIWSPRLASRYDWGAHVTNYFRSEGDFFKKEAQILASIAHPALCGVHDFGIGRNGIPWMALEYIPGDTLRARMADWRNSGEEPLLSDVLDIFQQLADAVAFLHSSSHSQLDLKPENVLLDGARVRLIDFANNLERPSDNYAIKGARHGTPGYVAPELIIRARADEEPVVTPAADIFSLGVILLEMVTGENPLATEPLQRAAYKALGIIEREIYGDYRTAAFFPDFSEELAEWAAAYVQGLRAIDLSGKSNSRLADAPPALIQLLRGSLSEAPGKRPPDGTEILARIASIRTSPPITGPVFISHSHGDKQLFVKTFVDALIERHVSVWYDSYDIRVGEPFWDRIFRALQQARFVIVVLSKNMIRSSGALEELRYAHLENLNRVKILPILIDETPFESLPPSLRSRHILRFPQAADRVAFLSSVDDLVQQMRDLSGE